MTDQKILEVARIKDFIPIIEKRAKISMNDFLGKQPLTSPLKAITYSSSKYYGELNAVGEKHGRGIRIRNDGNICIGCYENGNESTGNYIYIASDGVFLVGEVYFKDGK
jgi:hypothetical protein